MKACATGNKSILRDLIDAKCDPTLSDIHQKTADEFV